MNRLAVFGGLAAVLLAVNVLIVQKEILRTRGDVVLLELAPRDPRSIMQGDYMELRYSVSRAALEADASPPRDGRLVLKMDPVTRVGRFSRFDRGEPLQPGEQLLRYRRRHTWDMLRLGAEAFAFQEGTADQYDKARYGELRVTSSGNALLVGLRDAELRTLGRTP